jgi:myo-inositol-1(or 4)-monophosphatase
MNTQSTELLDTLESICRRAGDSVLALRPETLDRTYKEEREFMTAADLASQQLIEEQLRKFFPDIPLVAEEQTNPAVPSRSFFTADPIDGTHVYAHGAKEWGVTIAYVEDGLPHSGVIYLPALATLMRAQAGKGCFVNGRRIRLAPPAALSHSVIGLEIHSLCSPEKLEHVLLPVGKAALNIRSLGSIVSGMLDLLTGVTAAYLNPQGGKIWDYAAAAVGVNEAGGVTLDWTGTPLSWNSLHMGALFAANDEVAREIVAAYNR